MKHGEAVLGDRIRIGALIQQMFYFFGTSSALLIQLLNQLPILSLRNKQQIIKYFTKKNTILF